VCVCVCGRGGAHIPTLTVLSLLHRKELSGSARDLNEEEVDGKYSVNIRIPTHQPFMPKSVLHFDMAMTHHLVDEGSDCGLVLPNF
jgi:hypothetical protein